MEHGTNPLSKSFFQFANNRNLHAEIGQIMQEQARYSYVLEVDKGFLEDAEDTMWDALQICFGSKNDGLKNAFFRLCWVC